MSLAEVDRICRLVETIDPNGFNSRQVHQQILNGASTANAATKAAKSLHLKVHPDKFQAPEEKARAEVAFRHLKLAQVLVGTVRVEDFAERCRELSEDNVRLETEVAKGYERLSARFAETQVAANSCIQAAKALQAQFFADIQQKQQQTALANHPPPPPLYPSSSSSSTRGTRTVANKPLPTGSPTTTHKRRAVDDDARSAKRRRTDDQPTSGKQPTTVSETNTSSFLSSAWARISKKSVSKRSTSSSSSSSSSSSKSVSEVSASSSSSTPPSLASDLDLAPITDYADGTFSGLSQQDLFAVLCVRNRGDRAATIAAYKLVEAAHPKIRQSHKLTLDTYAPMLWVNGTKDSKKKSLVRRLARFLGDVSFMKQQHITPAQIRTAVDKLSHTGKD